LALVASVSALGSADPQQIAGKPEDKCEDGKGMVRYRPVKTTTKFKFLLKRWKTGLSTCGPAALKGLIPPIGSAQNSITVFHKRQASLSRGL